MLSMKFHIVFFFFFFFFNDTATTEIYTLSLHDALPNWRIRSSNCSHVSDHVRFALPGFQSIDPRLTRSEEHTSELQPQFHLVCRLLLEKKNKNIICLFPVKKKKKKKNNTNI